mmetsp:Transcript_47484/g.148539  ORF Transcript_47484/g.148539 Transcript_47484/m.148539 type:complete len:1033 (-) Transcript_47484:1182-4280(-)
MDYQNSCSAFFCCQFEFGESVMGNDADSEHNGEKSWSLTSIQLERIHKNREAAKRIKLNRHVDFFPSLDNCTEHRSFPVTDFRTANNSQIHVGCSTVLNDGSTFPAMTFGSQFERVGNGESVKQPIGLSSAFLLQNDDKKCTTQVPTGASDHLFVDQNAEAWNELRLPEICVQLFKRRGIQRPYTWQLQCLKSEDVRRGKNLVYTLPTSAGKTFVAEVLLLRTILGRMRSKTGVKCLMVLPFVSLVKEKAKDLEPFGDALSICVESFHGYQGKFPIPQRTKQICIATIEKADRIIKELIEESRMSELSLVVVDEAHFVAEKGRGPLLEILLSRILTFFPETQIVAMSATMPNLNEFCNWMQAKSFQSETRPVDLKEYVKCGCQILENGSLFRSLPPPATNDPDHLAFLVKEAIQDKAPVIIFCATKASTEIVAKQLTLAAITGAEDTGLQQARNDVISALRSANEDANSDISLFAAISVGVSFHHSGLSSEERQIIEDAYKSGTISVLVATTTLAAGVNLPAGRVIVRTPYTGREFLTASRFKQMAGRAGRAGLGQKQGEAFLFVQPGERDRCFALVTQGPKAVESQLLHEAFQYSRTRAQTSSNIQPSEQRERYRGGSDLPAGDLFLRSILGFISAGRLPTRDGAAISLLQGSSRSLREDGVDLRMICNYFNQTLMSRQLSPNIHESGSSLLDNTAGSCNSALFRIILDCLQWLLRHKFVSVSREMFQYEDLPSDAGIEYVSSFYATSLGKATYLASIAVEDALALHHDLELARSEGIILVDQLHLLYLTAPVSGLREPNWSLLADKISQFDDNRKKVLQRIGIEESFVCLSAQGRLLKRTPRLEEQDFKSRRLWVALLLQELVEEKPVAAILRVYGAGKDRDGVGSAPGSVAIDKGYIEELQTVTASFASMVAQFSRNVGFEDLASLIQSLTGRIANGARSDVLPLCDIPFVQAKRAREMFRNGLRTVEDVASAKPQELVRMLGNLLGPTGLAMAKKIIQSAQNLHRKRLMELSQGMEIFAEEEEVEALS